MKDAVQDRRNRARVLRTAYCMYFLFGVISTLTRLHQIYLISMLFYPAKYQSSSIR